MNFARKKSTGTATWTIAIFFNVLLLLIPVFAAHITSTALASRAESELLTPDALAEIRREIDRSFAKLTAGSGEPRAVWAGYVQQELRERDLSAARGYLLAAPQMLRPDAARAIRAAADSDPLGSEDQRLVRAALLFLPDDVRADYEKTLNPPRLQLVEQPQPADPDNDADATTEDAILTVARSTRPVLRETNPDNMIDSTAILSVIGDPEDLVMNSQRWLAERQNTPNTDSFELRVTGLSHIVGELQAADAINVDLERFANAASVLKTAWRSGRIQPDYANAISGLLDDVLPEADLAAELEVALSGIAPRRERVAPVLAAYGNAVRLDALPQLSRELMEVGAIVEATSPTGALLLIEEAADEAAVRQARRVAAAGSDRAVSLVKKMNGDVFTLVDVGIHWTGPLVLQVVALILATGGLGWLVIVAVSRAFTHRLRQPSLI